MRRAILDQSECPVARSLGCFGDPWSLLILRDALYGMSRFDEWERSLGIAPNILAARLKALVEDGLLERRRYCERPQRHEYHLTDAGRDARSVILSLLAWGNRHLAPEGHSVVVVNSDTGQKAEPVMVDGISGRALSDPVFRMAAGPAAGQRIRDKIAAAERAKAAGPPA